MHQMESLWWVELVDVWKHVFGERCEGVGVVVYVYMCICV